MPRRTSSRRNAALSTSSSQLSSPAMPVEVTGSSWWHPLAAAACASHHVLHSWAKSGPTASVSTIESTAARNMSVLASVRQQDGRQQHAAGRSRAQSILRSHFAAWLGWTCEISLLGAENPSACVSTASQHPIPSCPNDSACSRRRIANWAACTSMESADSCTEDGRMYTALA